jgi:hypothetical protein
MDDPYAELKAHFAGVDDVTVNSGRGSQGIKLGKKMFAMFYKGDLLLRFPPERVGALIAAGKGSAFDPGTGTNMADRILVPQSQTADWISLSEESHAYAASKSQRRLSGSS